MLDADLYSSLRHAKALRKSSLRLRDGQGCASLWQITLVFIVGRFAVQFIGSCGQTFFGQIENGERLIIKPHSRPNMADRICLVLVVERKPDAPPIREGVLRRLPR